MEAPMAGRDEQPSTMPMEAYGVPGQADVQAEPVSYTSEQVARMLRAEEDASKRAPFRMAWNGLTLGGGKRINALARSAGKETYAAALEDEQRRLDEYRDAYPIESTVMDVAGSAPLAFIPGVNAAAGANRVRQAAQTGQGVGHAVGTMGAKLGAAGGVIGSRDYTDIGQVATDAAIGGGAGYAIGRGLNAVAQPIMTSAGIASDALRTGSQPVATAQRQLKQAAVEGAAGHPNGSTFQDVSRRALDAVLPPLGPNANITRDGQMAILEAYHAAREVAGMTEAQARQAASAAYAATNPVSRRGQPLAQSTIDSHVNNQIAAYAQRNRVPLLAPEVLSGGEAPLQGPMQGFTRGIMKAENEGGARLTRATNERMFGTPSTSAQGRTVDGGAINRTRDLIDDTIGANMPQGTFNQQVDAIEAASRAARNAAYNRAADRSRGFDLRPVINDFADMAQYNTGDTRRAIITAANDMNEWFNRMTQVIQNQGIGYSQSQRGLDGNRLMLNSYRQARGELRRQATALRAQPGGREPAALIEGFVSRMDNVVMRRNPEWARATRGAAESFRTVDAANDARGVSLSNWRNVDDMRHGMPNLTPAEAEAQRLGLADNLRGTISQVRDGADVSQAFKRGGDGAYDDGIRGLLSDVAQRARTDAYNRGVLEATNRGVSPRAAQAAGVRERNSVPPVDELYRNIDREQIVASTQRLTGGSPTNPLQQSEEKRNRVLQAVINIMHNPNPMQVLPHIMRLMQQRASAARDAELGRMLATSTDRPDQLFALLRQLAAASDQALPGMTEAQIQAVLARAGAVSGAAGGSLARQAQGG